MPGANKRNQPFRPPKPDCRNACSQRPSERQVSVDEMRGDRPRLEGADGLLRMFFHTPPRFGKIADGNWALTYPRSNPNFFSGGALHFEPNSLISLSALFRASIHPDWSVNSSSDPKMLQASFQRRPPLSSR